VWIGEAAQICASYVRKQKTDKRDAGHILKLLVEKRFPRIWEPDAVMRDQRQLLIHRHELVQIRTRMKNELQHLIMNQGAQKKHRLWSAPGRAELFSLDLQPWAGQRREDLLDLLKTLDRQIEQMDQAVADTAQQSDQARLLMTQPEVGPVTALAFVLSIGGVKRFDQSKQVASYLGLIPRESSSGGKQHMGSISKQGNRFLRYLLVEATSSAVRFDPGFNKEYAHRCHHKHRAVAKVAAARKLAVRFYWVLRTQIPYPNVVPSRVARNATWSAQARPSL
jgi:transposase